MIWNICFILSLALLLSAAIWAIKTSGTYKSNRIFTPFHIIFAGVFLAVFTGLTPVQFHLLAGEAGFLLKFFIFNILQTIQVFTLDAGTDLILEHISGAATPLNGAYSVYMSVLFFIAPVFTFGFVISLFKNLIETLNYTLHYFDDVYAFSEISEKSLLLAESIRANNKDALLVFTNVDREEGNILSEHIESAKQLRAILLKKNIVAANLTRHSSKSQMYLFAIGEKENENLIESLKLLDKYRTRKNTHLYTFSSGTEGELLLAGAARGEVRLRRVNEVRSLIYRFLYDEGDRLFSSATETKNGQKNIHIVITGLGQYGTEILKAVTWFSQMDGYSLTVDVFDRDELAGEKFAALCPELMEQHPGETEYDIRIHSGVDVRTKAFAHMLAELDRISFVFVCLGDDEININQAANLRMLCERLGHKPVIKTIVYNTEENNALHNIVNYRGQAYGIEPMGDLSTSCSQELLLGSDLERLALERHLKWGEEEAFWQYEYNYRSSMASAIHMKAKIACNIPGADQKEADLTLAQRDNLERLEHRRWNAYMRSEGYVYSGSLVKSSRNDLGKMHHDLVDFDSLTEEEKRKDSSVASL